MITVEVKDAEANLKQLSRSLTSAEIRKASSRAINRTLVRARTLETQQIRKTYNLKAADTKRGMSIRNATLSRQTGYLNASSRPVSLSKFNPREVKSSGVTTQRRGAGFASRRGRARSGNTGVTVEIVRGKRVRIPSAFLLFSARVSGLVMARGHYTRSEFIFRRGKGSRIRPKGPDLPIEELNTISIYAAAVNERVQPPIAPEIEESYNDRLAHEMRFILSKVGSSR